MSEPRVRVQVDGGPALEFTPADSPIEIGRGLERGINLDDPLVSRRHARLEYEREWVLVDTGSRNGVWRDGHRVDRTVVDGMVRLGLGHESDGTRLTVTVRPTGPLPGPAANLDTALPARTSSSMTIGRDPSCDMVLADAMVSWHHARLVPDGHSHWLEDLGSTNDTVVNGARIQRLQLRDGDQILIGNSNLVYADGRLAPVEGEGFVVDDASLTIRGGRRIVDSVSFSLTRPSVIAIIGPSGAGKSSLLRMATGQISPSSGSVTLNGATMTSHRHAHRGQVGVVPQYTVAHSALTARQALEYTARLRLASDVSRSEMHQLVSDILGRLGLAPHADTALSRLSGGQQRRVGIAMEMLTDPSMLILDEPTAGLDPSLVLQIMTVLRGLADSGKQVLVVTHDLDHLDLVDKVLVLQAGGSPSYFGPPSGVFQHFGTTNWAETFDRLATPGAAFRTPTVPRSDQPLHLPATRRGMRAVVVQTLVVLQRQLRLIATDPLYLALLVGMPLALGALALAVPGDDGLARPQDPASAEATRLLVLLIVGGAFLGISSPIRDLVGERAIYAHERDAGLSSGAYLVAKASVFFSVAVIQCLLLVGLVLTFRPSPADALVLGSPGLEIGAAVVATALSGVALGLAISSRVATTEQTMPPLVLSVMGQLVMCGGLFPIDGRGPLAILSWAFPTRWTYAAAGATADLNNLTPSADPDDLWMHSTSTWVGCMLLVAVLTAVLLVLAATGVRRRLR